MTTTLTPHPNASPETGERGDQLRVGPVVCAQTESVPAPLLPHLAITRGPDEGACLPPGPINRGGEVNDPATSRKPFAFTGRAINRMESRTPITVTWPPCLRRSSTGPLRPGTRLRIGANRALLRAPASGPRLPGPRKPRFTGLMPAISLGLSLLFMARFFASGAFGLALKVTLLVACALLALALWPRTRLTAWQLTESTAFSVPAKEPGSLEGEAMLVWAGPARSRWLALRRDARTPRCVSVARGAKIAFTGPAALASARWVTAQLLARGWANRLQTEGSTMRLRWRPEASGRTVTLSAGGNPPPGSGGSTGVADEPEGCELIVLPPGSAAPSGCTTVVDARRAPGSDAWWSQLLTPETAGEVLSDATPSEKEEVRWLRHLESAREIRLRWNRHEDLCVPLLSDANRQPQWLDLATDGPHALVAGTTGAGKSEAMLAWLAMLCAQNPPSALQLVLIDYKGGAAFSRLAGMPHVCGVLSDLNEGETRRVISALGLELTRREQLLAQAGAHDLPTFRQLTGQALARIVIAVDELRELAQKSPDTLKDLNRLAAQGRSLGLHLIMATQRPGGAITPEIRANSQIRLALRVATSADSYDVLESEAAAKLPRQPGSCILRAADTARGRVAYLPPERLAATIAACRHAACGQHAQPFWVPPLPDVIQARDVGIAPAETLPLGLIERSPIEQPETALLRPGQVALVSSTEAPWLRRVAAAAAAGWSGRIERLSETNVSAAAVASALESQPSGLLWLITETEAVARAMDADYTCPLSFEAFTTRAQARGDLMLALGSPRAMQSPARTAATYAFWRGQADALGAAKMGLPADATGGSIVEISSGRALPAAVVTASGEHACPLEQQTSQSCHRPGSDPKRSNRAARR